MTTSAENISAFFRTMPIRNVGKTELQLQLLQSFKEKSWKNTEECLTTLGDLRALLSLIDTKYTTGSFEHTIFQMNPDAVRSEILKTAIMSLKRSSHISETTRSQLREVVVELIGIFETALGNQLATTDNWATEGQA